MSGNGRGRGNAERHLARQEGESYSSDSDEFPFTSNEMETSNQDIGRKKRGHTISKRNALRRPGEKLTFQFLNRRAVGTHVQDFVTMTGIWVRQHENAPLDVNHFRDISVEKKTKLWGLVKAKSKRNKENRGKQKINHLSGTVSFARRLHSMTQEIGNKPTRIDFFKKMHIMPNGSFVDTNSEEAIKRMDELVVHATPNGEDMNNIDENDIFQQVFGPERPRCVRGYGDGPTPTSLFGPRPSKDELHRQLKECEKEIIKLKETQQSEVSEIESRLKVEMESQREAHKAEMESQIEDRVQLKVQEVQAQFKSQMNTMMNFFKQMHAHGSFPTGSNLD